jgi:hypothetical protein
MTKQGPSTYNRAMPSDTSGNVLQRVWTPTEDKARRLSIEKRSKGSRRRCLVPNVANQRHQTDHTALASCSYSDFLLAMNSPTAYGFVGSI